MQRGSNKFLSSSYDRPLSVSYDILLGVELVVLSGDDGRSYERLFATTEESERKHTDMHRQCRRL